MSNKYSNSEKFFANTYCRYYPCHEMKDDHDMNCLFCFCPLYFKKCLGNPKIINGIKDCSDCTYPHEKNSYDFIIYELI
jgi:Zn-finger protein